MDQIGIAATLVNTLFMAIPSITQAIIPISASYDEANPLARFHSLYPCRTLFLGLMFGPGLGWRDLGAQVTKCSWGRREVLAFLRSFLALS